GLAQAAGLAWRKARTVRGAATALVSAVVSITGAIVAGQLSEAVPDPSPAGSLLGFLAIAAGVTGLVFLVLLAGLAMAGTATWLWRLAHHTSPLPPRPGGPAGRAPR